MATPNLRRQTERRALRVSEFCQSFGICKATLYAYMKDGRIRTVRIAGIRLIPAESVDEFIRGGSE